MCICLFCYILFSIENVFEISIIKVSGHLTVHFTFCRFQFLFPNRREEGFKTNISRHICIIAVVIEVKLESGTSTRNSCTLELISESGQIGRIFVQ